MTTRMQSLYIVALRPTNAKDDTALVNAARPYAAQSQGYILSNAPSGGLAHVILSLFRADNDAIANQTLELWPTDFPHDFSPTVTILKHKPDVTNQANVWTHLDLKRDEPLMGLQRLTTEHLTRLGFEPLTRAETFDPHFTFARRQGSVLDSAINPVMFPQGRVIPSHLDVLRATELGMALYSVSRTPLPTPAIKARLLQIS